MSPKESGLLDALAYANKTREWVRPMDLGGHDGSVHSVYLRRMVMKGWVESQERPKSPFMVRAPLVYRITDKGRQALANDALARRIEGR